MVNENRTQFLKNRKNLRLKNYDYGSDGAYFVTICINQRACLLGNIVNEQMVLNDAGLMVQKYYFELAQRFSNVKCGEHVIMPNHFHCIIHIQNDRNDVGVDQCVGPGKDENNNVGAIPCGCPNRKGSAQGATPTQLSNIIGAFKSLTTNAYINGVKNKNWPPFEKRLWQRNYYEHVIRNEQFYIDICQYIQDNPAKWSMDELNPNNYVQGAVLYQPV